MTRGAPPAGSPRGGPTGRSSPAVQPGSRHGGGNTPLPLGSHFGDETRTHFIGPFSCRELRHDAEQRTPHHSHEAAMLCLLLEGGFREVYPGGSWEEAAPAVVFRPPTASHADRFSERGARCLVIEIGSSWLAEAGSEIPLPERIICTAAGRAGVVKRLARSWAFDDGLAPLALEGLILYILEDLARIEPKCRGGRPRWLAVAEEFIRAHFDEQVTLKRIAKVAGVHPVTVARGFRGRHGCTVGEYIRAVRVTEAAERLVGSNESVSRIAVGCGFYDQSHLTNTLRGCLGLAPGRLRAASLQRTDRPPSGVR